MKLTTNFTGSSSGFDLKMDLDVDIEKDAESLGYMTSILFEAAKRLSELMESANPKYHQRMEIGVAKSVSDMQKEKNPYYPFTSYLQEDEK